MSTVSMDLLLLVGDEDEPWNAESRSPVSPRLALLQAANLIHEIRTFGRRLSGRVRTDPDHLAAAVFDRDDAELGQRRCRAVRRKAASAGPKCARNAPSSTFSATPSPSGDAGAEEPLGAALRDPAGRAASSIGVGARSGRGSAPGRRASPRRPARRRRAAAAGRTRAPSARAAARTSTTPQPSTARRDRRRRRRSAAAATSASIAC